MAYTIRTEPHRMFLEVSSSAAITAYVPFLSVRVLTTLKSGTYEL